MLKGRIEQILIAAQATQVPVPVAAAAAVAGRGLRGDRYLTGDGSFSHKPGSGRDLTLIEAEALDALRDETGIELEPAAARRNLVTRGISLNELVGKRFTIGDVVCKGVRLCDPCDHLEKLTQPGVLRGLVNRGGLRADILQGGEIRVGARLVQSYNDLRVRAAGANIR
jgi:MOSC domain-containing protein YiiM